MGLQERRSMMLTSNSRCWAEIDTSKIAHNVEEIRKMIPKQTKIMGIVKANAYGHGDVRIAQELIRCGVDFFGVSSVDEALHLREAGIETAILVLGYTPPVHFHYLHEYHIIQTLLSKEYAQLLSAYAKAHDVIIHAHVKVDTGMTRLGIQCKDTGWDIQDVISLYHLEHIQTEGIFSHFSVSDVLDKSEDIAFTKHQIELYDRVLSELRAAGIKPGITHLQNSYGIINYPDLHYDYVRPGLLHLGVGSDDTLKTTQHPDLWPIMTWKASISYVREVEKGNSVSYGRHYCTPKRTRIATISCGYADGYPRIVSNTGKEVLVHGQRAMIIGNVCMDQMMIDVSEIDDVKAGDEVVLFGYDNDVLLSVDDLSRHAHTINNETLCLITARVPRIYK